ncbi:hypothetical protein [Paracoccus indicus]|nr:hypothetical protein [Paracoccus indicus]
MVELNSIGFILYLLVWAVVVLTQCVGATSSAVNGVPMNSL